MLNHIKMLQSNVHQPMTKWYTLLWHPIAPCCRLFRWIQEIIIKNKSNLIHLGSTWVNLNPPYYRLSLKNPPKSNTIQAKAVQILPTVKRFLNNWKVHKTYCMFTYGIKLQWLNLQWILIIQYVTIIPDTENWKSI